MTQIDRGRSWILTVPVEHFTVDEMIEILSPYSYIFQQEQGHESTDKNKQGYEHYQLYIENKSQIRFETLRKKFKGKAHIEPRRGSRADAYAYCSKEDTRVAGPWKKGDIDLERNEDGSDSSFDALLDLVRTGQVKVADLLLNEPKAIRFYKQLEKLESVRLEKENSQKFRTDLKVSYIWGKAGTGKTRGVYEGYPIEQIYRVTDYEHPFDAYAGEKVLVLDEYRGQFSVSLLLNILDLYPLQLPARYTNKWAGYSRVYLISNIPLEDQYFGLPDETEAALMRRIHEIHHVEELGDRIPLLDAVSPL